VKSGDRLVIPDRLIYLEHLNEVTAAPQAATLLCGFVVSICLQASWSAKQNQIELFRVKV
jgi:hypothetical protein